MEHAGARTTAHPSGSSVQRRSASKPAIGTISRLSAEKNKQLVRRLIDEAVSKRNVGVIDELAEGEFAEIAKRWVRPFQSAFPDFEMEIVELIAEGDTVVGHFKCSGTHRGDWLGVPGTGRRFENVDEIYIFRVRGGKLVAAFGVEDNLTRLRQLRINPPAA
jgi:predicted ester cyclase